jgi:hypothetical protein
MLAGDNAKVARTRYLDTPDTVRPMRDHRPSRRVHFADSTTLILADHSAVRCTDGLRPAVGKSRDLRLPLATAGLSAALTAELLAAGLSATLTTELLTAGLAAGLSATLTAELAGILAATRTALLAGALTNWGLSGGLTRRLGAGSLTRRLSDGCLASRLSDGSLTRRLGDGCLASRLGDGCLASRLGDGCLASRLSDGCLACGLSLVAHGWCGATPAFLLVFLVLGVHGGGEGDQQHNDCRPNPPVGNGFTGSNVVH